MELSTANAVTVPKARSELTSRSLGSTVIWDTTEPGVAASVTTWLPAPISGNGTQSPSTAALNCIVPSILKLYKVPAGTGDVASDFLQTTISFAWAAIAQKASAAARSAVERGASW